MLLLHLPAAAADLVPRRTRSTIAAPLVSKAPVIDGKLEAAEWARSQPLREFAYRKGARHATAAWVCRDQKNFYVAARCFDDNPQGLVTENEGSAIWRNDCIELFIVPEKRELFFVHLILDCDGKTAGGTWVPDEWGEPTRGKPIDLAYKVGREQNAWTMELALPIAAFGRQLTPASVWALGVNREKHSKPGEVSSFQGGFNKPRQYPDLVFDGRAIVVDGVGLRNLSGKAARLQVELRAPAAGGDAAAKTRKLDLTLQPGAAATLPWQAFTAGMEAGADFAVIAHDAAGKELVRETYRLVPMPRKAGPVDLKQIPPARFVKSVLDDPQFFPVAVWAQPAGVAQGYAKMGVNLFVGGVDTYPRPKDKAWLDAIHQHGHYAVIPFKQKYLEQGLDQHPAFIGWMFGDEPDNVNPATGKVKHPPGELLADFARIRGADPKHPVFLNLGCGVAHERFVGRAATDEQYAQYAKACDILCFDVYPCNSIQPNGPDRLHLVAKGIDRLRRWGGPHRRAWAWIEVNHFGRKPSAGRAPTPDEVKTEIWMALVHGANGYGFFCHSWSKKFLKEKLGSKRSFSCSAIAPDMRKALAVINAQVKQLAPVLNSPTRPKAARVKATGSRVDILAKEHDGALYVFAVNMLRKPARASFTLTGSRAGKVEVLWEDRGLEAKNGGFQDEFPPYAVHLYKIR